ncbi:MAG: NUDIX hydrolase [Nanoarchaeota archaeon]
MADYDALHVVKGNAMAVLPEVASCLPFVSPSAAPTLSRDFDLALEERVHAPLCAGLINKGGYDDRKLRFDGHRSFWDCSDGAGGKHHLVLRFGPTIYHERAATGLPAHTDDALYDRLIHAGEQQYADPLAFFSRPFGVGILLFDSSGSLLLFRRSATASYAGCYHAVGGFVDGDPAALFRSERESRANDFLALSTRTLACELNEELGIPVLSPSLLGFVEGTTGVAAYYQSQILLPASVIHDSMFSASDGSCHDGVLTLARPQDMCDVITGNLPVVPECVGAMLLWLRQVDKELYSEACDSLPRRYGQRYGVLPR